MRTYLETHPWIKFELNLEHVSYKLWMALGEAQSKCEHIAGVPLLPSTTEKMNKLYLSKGVSATTAIEGNTLSEEDVLKYLEGTLKLPPSKKYLGQEINNITNVCEKISLAFTKNLETQITPEMIKDFNKMVLEKLKLEENVVPGEYRKISVGVMRYKAPLAEDCDLLINKLCEWINGDGFNKISSQVIINGVIKAIVAHIYIAWIHPFGDGNGRTSRLIEYQILVNSSVPAPAAHLLSNHYNQTRTEYLRQLDNASKNGGDILPFIEYAIEGFIDGLKQQLDYIREQQFDIILTYYIHELFKGKDGFAKKRQKYLALALSQQMEPVPLTKITDLNAEVAKLYAAKSKTPVLRDLKVLEEMGLIERTKSEGIRLKKELVYAFLPPRRKTI